MADKKTLLIVDDSEINRTILKEIVKNKYVAIEATNGEEAINIIKDKLDEIDLVLLDINMPIMDGMQVLEIMNKRNYIDDLPVVIISSETTSDYISRAYEYGATDYIARPYSSEIVIKRIKNTISLYSKKKSLQQEIAMQVNERQKENNMMINILSHIVEFRNGESGAHVQNINKFTRILFTELFNLTDKYDQYKDDLDTICTASSLHDIGKMAIDEAILNKPARLTKEEFEIMKEHTTAGYDMINKVANEYKDEKLIKFASNICLSHHEKWDGNGYPDGLIEDQIPIYAQIVSLADCYDALTSERCYKPAYAHEKALDMLLNNKCGVFNPLLIKCLLNIENKLKEVKQ